MNSTIHIDSKVVVRLLSFLALAVIFIACTKKEPDVFTHGMPQGSVPWLHDRFDDTKDKFTFAIVSDLNGGERKGIFEVAVEQLNLLRPELILSVGDLVDGESSNTDSIMAEFDHFDERARKAMAPLFHVGGNHDLTDPAMRKVWKDRYGAHYYYFVYKNVLFLILDTEDYSDARRLEIFEARSAAIKVMDGPNPEKANEMEYFKMPERVSGQISAEQSAYFTEAIKQHPEVKWTLLFMHKPVWKREEVGGLQLIESALAQRPYTLFNGHFHSYSHTVKNGRDYIILGTTGGSQPATDQNSFDQVALVTMGAEGPSIANLRLDGILNKTGKIPLNGDNLCFQASRCK